MAGEAKGLQMGTLVLDPTHRLVIVDNNFLDGYLPSN